MDTAQSDNVETIPTDIPDFERKTDDINTEEQKVESPAVVEPLSEKKETVIETAKQQEEALVGTSEAEAQAVERVAGEGEGVEETTEEKEVGTEAEVTQKEEESSSLTVDGTEAAGDVEGTSGGDDEQSASEIVRTATPGSRTSTPPPGTAHSAAPKKFSAVNVTKKFLSKTSQPAVTPAPGSKLGLNGRPSASPVPIATPSRLLSTKLTTAPLAKSSASPNPPAPGVTPASSSSPWAKPNLLPDATSSDASSSDAPTWRSLAIGQGQGIGGSKPAAWKAVQTEGRSRFGMSRDFPTTREIAEGESRMGREIAEGKMQAQMAAQQHAAHNQALLKSLNAFTNVDSAHRWDDDDDEDMIDFGDKLSLPTARPPIEASAKPAQYVAADDFDRSWPRKAPVEISTIRRSDEPRDRVLFNASSNRLEPSLPRQNASQPPTRLMSRNSSGTGAGSDQSSRLPTLDRPLPPHQQNAPPPQPGNRALPPHMVGIPESSRLPLQPSSQPSVGSGPGRSSWGPRDLGRSTQPAHPESMGRQDTLSPVKTSSALPSRPTWEQQANAQTSSTTLPPRGPQQAALAPPPAQPVTAPVSAPTQAATPAGNVDEQTAEMHTAADRARLRRLAEEAERSAAMERARKKAKEMEERLGLKPVATPVPTHTPAPVQISPPVPSQPALLRRPIPTPAPVSAPAPPPGLAGMSGESATHFPGRAPATTKSDPSRQAESSWRRVTPSVVDAPKPSPAEATIPEKQAPALQQRVEHILPAPARTPVEPNVRETVQPAPAREAPPHVNVALPAAAPLAAAMIEAVVRLPGQAILPESDLAGKKESGFDNMLARIQAAMAEARLAPPSIAEIVAIQSTASALPVPPTQPQPTQGRSQLAAPTPSRPTEIFNVTQIPPPRSPPPAWRTYSVRLPSTTSSRSPISPLRLKAADTPTSYPQGWLLVFEPSLDLPPNTILADYLVPRPIYQQRFGRPVDAAPVVSISPRKLEPFERKKKKVPAQSSNMLSDVMQPPTAAENLIAPLSSGYAWQQADRTTAVAEAGPSTSVAPAQPAVSVPTIPSPPTSIPSANRLVPDSEVGAASALGLSDQTTKSRSPVKAAAPSKAGKEGQFAQVAAGDVGPIARSKPAELKTGVRFMVSSELEGDSLLDEVNKMSLETVGEGWGGDEKADQAPKTPGSETPKTPPSLNSGQPTSPGTPWSRSTPRGASQHDHLKSVWDLAGSADAASARTSAIPTELPLPPPLISVPSTQSAQSDVSTPQYPSLNAPSPSENIPSQPLSPSAANKVGYPGPASTFSPGGAFMRPQISQPGYMYHAASPTDPAENYGSVAGRPNGGFSVPWSPAAFGASMTSPGYGYAGKQQQIPQQQPSPVDPKGVAGHYGFSQAAFSQQQAYGQAYGQQPQHQLAANAYARGVGAGTYAYGYPQQGAAGVAGAAGSRVAGRFGPHVQAQVNGDYAQAQAYGGEGAGYYQQQQRQAQHIGQLHSPVYSQGSNQLPHPHAQQQYNHQSQSSQQQPGGIQGQGYSAGAVGQQIMRGGRKMW